MPGDDSAFGNIVAPFELQASPGSPAFGRMDLLTVVEHELGHVLGLSDLDPQAVPHSLMTQTLDTGVRRLPAPEPAVASTPVVSALPGISQIMGTVPGSPSMYTGSINPGQASGNGAISGVSSGHQPDGTAVGPSLVAMPSFVVGQSGSAGVATTPFGAAAGERLGEPASPQSPGLVVGAFDRTMDPSVLIGARFDVTNGFPAGAVTWTQRSGTDSTSAVSPGPIGAVDSTFASAAPPSTPIPAGGGDGVAGLSTQNTGAEIGVLDQLFRSADLRDDLPHSLG
jgi:hypothetical protein